MLTLLIVLVVLQALVILVLLLKSRKRDGQIVVQDIGKKVMYSLELDKSPEEWSSQKKVVLQIRTESKDRIRE